MKSLSLPRLSLRARFALDLGALFLQQYTTIVIEEVVEEAVEEMDPVMHLQTLMQMAAMPPNEYLVHGAKPPQMDTSTNFPGPMSGGVTINLPTYP